MNNIYIRNGYDNRKDYLKSLSEQFNIDIESIYALSDMLGINEDFDGLVSSLDDYNYLIHGKAFHLN